MIMYIDFETINKEKILHRRKLKWEDMVAAQEVVEAIEAVVQEEVPVVLVDLVALV